jgi:hypothetical protein
LTAIDAPIPDAKGRIVAVKCTTRLALVTGLAASLLIPPVAASAAPEETFSPGASGVGDPYFPLEGNGGYESATIG